MFKGNDGKISSTKILSFISFLCFLIVSIVIVFTQPDKFDYQVFALMAGGMGGGMKIADKILNTNYGKDKVQ